MPDNNHGAPWRTGIRAITLIADDLDEAREFYLGVLEVPAHFEEPDSVVFTFGDAANPESAATYTRERAIVEDCSNVCLV